MNLKKFTQLNQLASGNEGNTGGLATKPSCRRDTPWQEDPISCLSIHLPRSPFLTRAGRALTIDNGPAGDLPQHQAKGPDVSPLVGLEAVGTDLFVQHLWGHVPFGAYSRIVANVQVITTLGVHHSQPCGYRACHFCHSPEPTNRVAPQSLGSGRKAGMEL